MIVMKKRSVYVGLWMLLACASLPVHAETAHHAKSSLITTSDAWLRAMPPSVRTTAGYVVIHNQGAQEDQLIGARMDGVKVVEVHEMVHEGDTVAMRHREAVAIPAGGSVSLAPGGLHLMVIEATHAFKVGDAMAGVLKFRDAGDVPVKFSVRAP